MSISIESYHYFNVCTQPMEDPEEDFGHNLIILSDHPNFSHALLLEDIFAKKAAHHQKSAKNLQNY